MGIEITPAAVVRSPPENDPPLEREDLSQIKRCATDDLPPIIGGVGARVIRTANGAEPERIKRRRSESLTIWTIMAAVGLPVLLACFLVAADMRSDLSELRPAKEPADASTALIGWPDLDGRNGHAVEVEHAIWQPHPRVRMLGYMMDGYRASPNGAQLEMFVLMPKAGQFLRPAHRIPNEMVEVWLRRPLPFKFRALIWASGILERTGNGPRGEMASYAMRDAEIEPAEQREITRWFGH